MRAAVAGHRAARARMAALADVPGVRVRRGPGWLAVSSGVASNDLNGVVASARAPSSALLRDLDAWFGDLPAQWLAATADPSTSAALLHAGWSAERTGVWAGRALSVPTPSVPRSHRVRRVRRVGSDTDLDADLDAWLDVAGACGWWEGAPERALRRRLAAALPWPRYLAVVDGTPVGMATGWSDGDLVEVVDVAVVGPARRQGLGRELVAAVLDDAPDARHAVAAPSPDGSRLLAALGFALTPVEADVCFYRSGS